MRTLPIRGIVSMLFLACLSCELGSTAAADLPSWSTTRRARGLPYWPGELPPARDLVADREGDRILLSGHGFTALFDAGGTLLGMVERGETADLLSQRSGSMDSWRVELVGRDKRPGRKLRSRSTPPRVELGEAALTLTWQPIAEQPSFQVRVSWRLCADRGLCGRIEIQGAPADELLGRVEFPVLASPAGPSDLDLVVPRSGWGELAPFRGSTYGLYPSSSWNMQFLGWTDGSRGLYLAAEDPSAGTKSYRLRAGGEFSLQTVSVSQSGGQRNYVQRYDFVVQPVSGDWLALAKRYRRFAVADGSLATTPLRERSDIPEALRDGPYWWLSWDTPKRIVAEMRGKRALVDLPTAVLWYQWYPRRAHSKVQGPHWECGLPEAFEPSAGLGPALRGLRKQGVQVFPYLNAVSADTLLPDFAQRYAPHALRALNGAPVTREWGCRGPGDERVPFAQMDLSAAEWRRDIASRARQLMGFGATGIYLDQLGGMPNLNVERNAFYPAAAGNAWARGGEDLIASVNGENSAPVIIEHPSDAYVSEVAAMLFYKTLSPRMIPIHSAVYSEYRIALGAGNAGPECGPGRAVCDSDDAFAGKLAQAFLWGAQLGLKTYWLAAPKERAKLEFSVALATARRTLRDHLAYGEFLGSAEVDVSMVSERWWGRAGGKPENVSLPAIRGTRWRSGAGEEIVVVVNWTGRRAEGLLQVPASWPSTRVDWCEVPLPCRSVVLEAGRASLAMPPRSIRLLKPTAANGS